MHYCCNNSKDNVIKKAGMYQDLVKHNTLLTVVTIRYYNYDLRVKHKHQIPISHKMTIKEHE